MKILLCSFEPRNSSETDYSLDLIKRLKQSSDSAEYRTIFLPQTYGLAGARAVMAIRLEAPDVVLCLGAPTAEPQIILERLAINLNDSDNPDLDGYLATEEAIVPGAPDAYFSNLKLHGLKNSLNLAGFATRVSNAGSSDVDNNLYYCVLHEMAFFRPEMKVLMLHMPQSEGSTLSEDEQVRAIETIIEQIRGTEA